MRARGSRKLSWNGLAPSFQLLYVSDEGRWCHEASLGPYSFCLFNVKWRKISKVHAWVALVLCVIWSHVVEFKGVSHLILSLSADTRWNWLEILIFVRFVSRLKNPSLCNDNLNLSLTVYVWLDCWIYNLEGLRCMWNWGVTILFIIIIFFITSAVIHTTCERRQYLSTINNWLI